MWSREENLGLRGRFRTIRRVVYDELGIPDLAEHLGVPPRTWENYEKGVIIPGVIVLRFIALTDANPSWLLTGVGEPFSDRLPAPFPVVA